MIETASENAGFRKTAFKRFEQVLSKEYQVCDYSAEIINNVPALSDWINPVENATLLISRIRIDNSQKDEVYAMIDEILR